MGELGQARELGVKLALARVYLDEAAAAVESGDWAGVAMFAQELAVVALEANGKARRLRAELVPHIA